MEAQLQEQAVLEFVWVGNLAPSCTPEQLLEHFSVYRPYIVNVPEIREPATSQDTPQAGTKKFFTILHFKSTAKAQEVIQAMNGSQFFGNKLKLKEYRKSNPNSKVKRITHGDKNGESTCSAAIADNSKVKDSPKRQIFGSVIVGNLPPGSTSQEVSEHFSAYMSDIDDRNNIPIRESPRKDGTLGAFLNFNKPGTAEVVVREMNGTSFKGNKVTLKVQNSTRKQNPQQTPHSTSSKQIAITNEAAHTAVFVSNIPPQIDTCDLKGLVANLKPVSCSDVCDQTATLTFASNEQATNAVKILDQKSIGGLSLTASLNSQAPAPHIQTQLPSTSPLNPMVPAGIPHAMLGSSNDGRGPNSPYGPSSHTIPNLPPPQYQPPSSSLPQHPSLPLPGSMLPIPHQMHSTGGGGYGNPHYPGNTPLQSMSNSVGFDTRSLLNAGTQQGLRSYTKRVSHELYGVINKMEGADFHRFIQNGGFLKYDDSTSTVTVEGLPAEVAIIVNLLEKFTEREITYSPAQWNSLIAVQDRSGKRKLDDIITPFQHNPALRIVEKQLKLVLVGQTEAVNNAYQVISKDKKKESKINSDEFASDSLPSSTSSTHVFKGKRFHRHLLYLLKQHDVLKPIDYTTDTRDKAVLRVNISGDGNAIAEAQTTLNALDPCVISFSTRSHNAKDTAKKIASELENQQRCRIYIDLQKPKIAIFGLTRAEVVRAKSAIEDYINENNILVKHIPSTRPIPVLQMKYILLMHDKELKGLSNKFFKDRSQHCTFPRYLIQKDSFDLQLDSCDATIKVKGTSKLIDEFDKSLAVFVSDDFTAEEFSVNLQNIHRFPWKKRWEVMKQEACDAHVVRMEYKICGPPKNNSNEVKFIVYGNQPEAIKEIRETIESDVEKGVRGDKIKLSSENVRKVDLAIRKGKLNFNDYIVEIKPVEESGIIFVNTLAVTEESIELVRTEIEGFVSVTDTSFKEVVPLDDPLVFRMFSSTKSEYYSQAFSIARKMKVFFFLCKKAHDHCIKLTGNKASASQVKLQIEELIEQIKGTFDTKQFVLNDPVQVCVLAESNLRNKLERKLLYTYNIKISFDHQLLQQSGHTASVPLQWYWRNDQGGYSPYSMQECDLMNRCYQQSTSGNLPLVINGVSYTIDFTKMVQINNNSQFEREITTSAKPTASSHSWYWMDDSSKMSSYTSAQSAKLEGMFQAKNPETMKIGQQSYRFDFEKMEQVNVSSNFSRKIERRPAQIQLTHASSNQPDVQGTTHPGSKAVVCTISGPKSNLDSSEQEVYSHIKQSIREERVELQYKIEEGKVNEIVAKQSGVMCELVKDSQGKHKTLVIKGSSNVDKAAYEVQKYIIEQQSSAEDLDLPKYWEPQENTTQLFPIQKGSEEWRTVETVFNQTMSSHSIKEIHRIQNLYLWVKWLEERKRIEKFKGCVNEKKLFHGTRSNNPNVIYDSEIGFDMRFCTSGMWGRANYFAVNASYSHNYAYTGGGHREMFLVQLITGDSYACPSNGSLTMPPLKSDSQMGLSQVRYDTVTGNTNGSQVFMSYDNQKAYPAYLIKY